MAIFNGTDLILKVSPSSGGTEAKLMHSQNVSISMNVDTIDISTKDSSGFRDLLVVKSLSVLVLMVLWTSLVLLEILK